MKFSNPIIPGFNPDPSVILHEDTFFLVTSSFHMFPGLPIYSSKDLQSWTQIGNAINRPGQISLDNATTKLFPRKSGSPMVATTGLWAPTIRYYKGTFYIVCTNTTSDGSDFGTQNFIITCTDIWANDWSDPILFDFDGIDPSLYFEDDRAYIQGCWSLHSGGAQPTCTIKQLEVDIKTGKALSETKEIWEGFAKIDSEGPHIYKKDGWYYLLLAEGGTFEHHLLSIARSKDIWGPYEGYEGNPIMTADGKDEYLQNVGHGELFHDPHGQWWAAVLGIRDANGRFPLGRETFLTPVEWPENEWPSIRQPKIEFERGTKLVEDNSSPLIKPGLGLLYLRDPDLENYMLSGDFRMLTLRASESDLKAETGTTTFLGTRQGNLNCSISATLDLSKENDGKNLVAGLTLFKDSQRHASLQFNFSTSTILYDIFNNVSTTSTSVKGPKVTAGSKVQFEIRASEMQYEFLYRLEGEKEWTILGSLDTIQMTARDFTGTIFGVFVNGKGDAVGSAVIFRDFEQRLGELKQVLI